jgi:hypothetical protein
LIMRLRRLDLRVDPGGGADWPVVTVLVDGADVIGDATGFQGFDPDMILGDDRPLVPLAPLRRVAVYRCSCGEPGCGVAAAVISTAGEVVTWTDFRDFTGVYGGSRSGTWSTPDARAATPAAPDPGA